MAGLASQKAMPILNPMEHLSPKETQEFLDKHKDAVLVDCRSEFEFLFVGDRKSVV